MTDIERPPGMDDEEWPEYQEWHKWFFGLSPEERRKELRMMDEYGSEQDA